jgi:hypothetical protein
MRSTIIALCVLGMPCISSAQLGVSSWASINTLQSGQKIQVVQMNSKKVSGTFLNVSDAGITLQEKAGEKTIERPDVRIVRLMKNKHRLRNTFIGAGIGAGAGAGIGAASYRPCTVPQGSFPSTCLFSLTRGQQAAIFAAPGVVIGAAVGALWPTKEIIYRVGGAG